MEKESRRTPGLSTSVNTFFVVVLAINSYY